MSPVIAQHFTELRARERVGALLDPGTFRELLDPFARVESPHLMGQGIVPQSDDGAVIGRGRIDGVDAVVIALDGAFQGGGIGEISGAKVAGALERALRTAHSGQPIRIVLLLETGGIRLQEANLGLLAIAEIHAAIVALRQFVPVVGVIAGTVGCFGGMGIAAGLTSHLIMTAGGRLGLNGPEVIETEAGIDELDASDRAAIWAIIGGAQRVRTGFADVLVVDDVADVRRAVLAAFTARGDQRPRAERLADGRRVISSIDSAVRPAPQTTPSLKPSGVAE
jgi:malonate decarboxylase beta subunit